MLQHVALEVPPDTVDACVGFWALLGFSPHEKPQRLKTSSTWVAREATPEVVWAVLDRAAMYGTALSMFNP